MREQHLTLEQFADREGVPVATVYAWNYRGIGPTYLKVGKHVRYRLSDVVAWENSRARGGRQAIADAP